jgi:hypothetical protein
MGSPGLRAAVTPAVRSRRKPRSMDVIVVSSLQLHQRFLPVFWLV